MLITSADRTVPITVLARTSAGPADAFRILAPIDLTRVFLADRLFPGVAAVADQTGTWDRAGASRRPRFTDGTSVTESLTEYVDGRGFAYELTGFTNALATLALGVRGEFSFLPDGEGTIIRWTYEFKPRPGRRWIVAGPFRPLWQRYMQSALRRMVAIIEGARPESIGEAGHHLRGA
ncbi:SRPBCC family protein [Pseudosporangium ferrugineum]|uniref:Polyketide cyclase/dehydrase/lipid transport protein n=1 Tax=Pseudosporangium ferrugineum TaxID=439699 RepID=A0A2T0RIJ1_9ACTN|nr:SRPBCC family protein [Pseudosporangium ferrugineum]PRY21026.1 polyketide cyclase/dehydrase/lipid transport protein [Pseudosporangium ferrugineum]